MWTKVTSTPNPAMKTPSRRSPRTMGRGAARGAALTTGLAVGLATLGCAPTARGARPVVASAGTASAAASAASDPDASATAPSVHVLAAGETLWRVAHNYGVSVDQLALANQIKDVRTVRAGLRLTIPTSGRKGAASVADASATSGAGRQGQGQSGVAVAGAAAHSGAAPHGRYPLRWPIDGAITSRFGTRDGQNHDGIDIDAPSGAAVHAAASGQVIFADGHAGYGNMVIVRHVSGLVTIYAHNSRLLVHKGDPVSAGQVIASVGATGRATGPHLHFEVRKGVAPENPLHFLPP